MGVAGSPERTWELVEVDLATGAWAALPRAAAPRLPVEFLSEPQRRTFTGVGGREVHAVVHPPRHPDHAQDAGRPPPYLVFVHGGPTSRYPPVVDPEIAFFTSRGLGVVDVDYGGTTGYGRAYRERLREGWGVVDVEDSVAVALGLVAEGSADPERLAIRGGSAGGFTSACALVAGDVFACATIRYPILDLTGWRTGETHDFESRYLEGLVGPWPEAKARYEARSPVNRTDRIGRPFLLLQGLDDVICPPVQSERLLERVSGRGVPHAYLTFEGESHGFRKEETLVATMEAELSFYGQIFGFEPPGIPLLELTS